MHILLIDFCELVKALNKSNAEKAVAILWFHDQKTADTAMKASALTSIMSDHHVGTLNAGFARNPMSGDGKMASNFREWSYQQPF